MTVTVARTSTRTHTPSPSLCGSLYLVGLTLGGWLLASIGFGVCAIRIKNLDGLEYAQKYYYHHWHIGMRLQNVAVLLLLARLPIEDS